MDKLDRSARILSIKWLGLNNSESQFKNSYLHQTLITSPLLLILKLWRLFNDLNYLQNLKFKF